MLLKRLFGDARVDVESWRGENCMRSVFDDTMLVIAYADQGALTDEVLEELQPFLFRLGQRSREGEAGIVIWDGAREAYFNEFDSIGIDACKGIHVRSVVGIEACPDARIETSGSRQESKNGQMDKGSRIAVSTGLRPRKEA